MQNIANHAAKKNLSENIRKLLGGFSQDTLQRAAQKSGVSARTIGNMISLNAGNPTLANICAIAAAYKVTPAELLSPNLGKGTTSDSTADRASSDPILSAHAAEIISRIVELDRQHLSPPALYALIENALSLVQPNAGPRDYPGLDDL